MAGKPTKEVKHKRTKKKLNLTLIVKSKTSQKRQQNRETLELAVKIRYEREQELKEEKTGIRLPKHPEKTISDETRDYFTQCRAWPPIYGLPPSMQCIINEVATKRETAIDFALGLALGAASIAIGSQCKNVKRLRYTTFNPEPYVNNDSLVFCWYSG